MPSLRRSRAFTNDTDACVTYWVEPWSHAYVLKPGEALELIEHVEPGKSDRDGEVRRGERAVFVWVERASYEVFIAGQKVEPGYQAQLGYWREEFLRYGHVELALDRSASSISAFIHPDDPYITWSIELATVQELGPCACDDMEAHTPVASSAVVHWQDLAGSVMSNDFEQDELFFDCGGDEPAILPDTPATIYTGEHSALNQHRVSFTSSVKPCHVLVEWTCNAYASASAAAVPVVGRGTLRLSSVKVWSEDRPVDLSEAQRLVREHFAGVPMLEPERTSSGFEFSVAIEENLQAQQRRKAVEASQPEPETNWTSTYRTPWRQGSLLSTPRDSLARVARTRRSSCATPRPS